MLWTDDEIEELIRQERIDWYGPGAENLIVTHEDCALVRLGARFSADLIRTIPFAYQESDLASDVANNILDQVRKILIFASKEPR